MEARDVHGVFNQRTTTGEAVDPIEVRVEGQLVVME